MQHYIGYKDKKKTVPIHRIQQAPSDLMEVNGSKSMEVKKACNGIFLGKEAPPKGLEPLTDWLTASRSTGLSYGGTA